MPRLLLQVRPDAGRRRNCVQRQATRKRLSLPESRARVKPIVDASQPRLEDVRVDLRGRQIGVPEHHLDRAQVGAALEQVRRERMTQHVRAERAADAGPAAVRFQNLPEADARSASRRARSRTGAATRPLERLRAADQSGRAVPLIARAPSRPPARRSARSAPCSPCRRRSGTPRRDADRRRARRRAPRRACPVA